jgi:hypothetical protein
MEKMTSATVKHLFGDGFSPERIAEITGLDIRRINEIIKNKAVSNVRK